MVTPADMPALPGRVNALYFGGLSFVADPAGAANATLLEGEAKRRFIIPDRNIKPSFVTDEAAYRLRLDLLLAHSDIVEYPPKT